MSGEFMMETVDLLFQGWGIGFPDMMLLGIVCLSFIFAYQDHRIGFIAMFLMSIAAVVFFFLNGIDTARAIALVFIALILMSFSLYYTSEQGGLF